MNTDSHHVIDFSTYMSHGMQPHRRFLFIQGPHGDFFKNLAQTILAEGHSVHRIHLNGGDKGDWMPNQGISYTGLLSEWKQYLAEYLFRNSITDIVFYGYWRPHHRVAAILAEKLDIRIHAFEEGLLRPHWITLDPRLPGEQADDIKATINQGAPLIMPYATNPSANDVVPDTPVGSMIFRAIKYYLNYFRHRALFSQYRSHRLLASGVESRAWIRQFFTYPVRTAIAQWRLAQVQKDETPFFLFCMQLDGDSQIQRYSSYEGMEQVLEQVLESFARHAPANCKLVVKNHPLDNGIINFERMCNRITSEKGISDRVTFIALGKLAGLLKRTLGMVAVNSSAGLQALHHGIPVKTLGQSVYNIEDLVDPQPLDHFWQAPMAPSKEVYTKLQHVLQSTSQHPGNFYDPTCHAAMIASVMPLLLPEEHAKDFVQTDDLSQAANY